MKKTFLSLVALVCMLAAIFCLSACGDPSSGDPPPSGWTPTGNEITLITKDADPVFTVVYEEDDSIHHTAALDFYSKLSALGFNLNSPALADDGISASEIVIGPSPRGISTSAVAFLDEYVKQNGDGYYWVFYYYDGKLNIIANRSEAYPLAIESFTEKYAKDGKVAFKDTLKELDGLSAEEYAALLRVKEDEYLSERTATNALLIDGILNKIDEQRVTLSKDPDFSTYTLNIGTPTWGTVTYSPKAEHPRLLITGDMIPRIKERLYSDNATFDMFKQYVEKTLPNEGILPDAVYLGNNATLGGTDISSANIHNYDDSYLEVIKAKALAYLVYGDEYYGYEAIYYMKNYLVSLDIQRIASDMCRQYGHVMFTSALVYDWCYDLLTEEDRVQFIAGIEHKTASGYCGLPDSFSSLSSAKKMEVGFPPSGQGSVSGHGSEYQVMRDYLSVAVAIYDENSSWWDYVSSRVVYDYAAVRSYYFKSGIAQQGTGYSTARHIADLYAGWILQVATGNNPFEGMENTVRSFLGLEYGENSRIFNDGDGTGLTYKTVSSYAPLAHITAFLYGDATMLAQGNFGRTVSSSGLAYEKGYSGLTCATFVALVGLSDLEPAEDRHEGMPLIQYNGSPLGQYVIRERWNDNSAAAVFMRIKERSTGNHEHEDSGTFMIFYKGMLTSDGGAYNNYGHEHTQLFHQATISHNGLIIFDAASWNPNSATNAVKWYSGGQKSYGESSNLKNWLNDKSFDSGVVTGRQHAYSDEAETKPLYAYIAGDITAAYPTDAATYVGRRMLTVYTGDAEFPMAFFVYDDISSTRTNQEKRFLLQITSADEPTVDEDEQTVITENGGGRLVLTCLSKDVTINKVGGRVYNADGTCNIVESSNYLVNGIQLVPKNQVADDGHWGRIEIVSTPTRASKLTTFMNVLYVTDAGNKNMAKVKKITSSDYAEGAIFDEKIVGVFVTDRERREREFSFKTSGADDMSYYVSGVREGSWTVTVDGKSCGTFTATAEGGLLTFTAPAGTVVISPVK